jgi:DNA topoisomerase-1
MPGSTLVIVESPAKAKSIAKMLGQGFEVRASKGHVADLPERDLGVDVEADFAPQYEIKKDKKPVVDELKRAARGKKVLIATDPDREGEAIGWHVARLLELDQKAPLRVEFHEITPKVVREAIARPRPIDQSLVDAQQARRVLDRLVGYKLSPVLSMEFRRRALSAGRVQSVALRLLVEREQEIEAFVPQEYWTLEADFQSEASRFKAQLYAVDGERLQSNGTFLVTGEAQAQSLAQRAKAVSRYAISKVERKERRRSAAPPFTTSTLQQAASGRLGWTASRTMRVAQRLYEGVDLPEGTVGLITYMRTDSVRVSQEALSEVRKVIPREFGPGYLPEKPNFYATKKANAQDAHEAIRPTYPARTPSSLRAHLSDEEYKLYDLIWRRFVASQMVPAVFDQTTVTVEGGGLNFRAVGSVLKFEGFLKAWGREGDPLRERQGPAQQEEGEDGENILPALREGAEARLLDLASEQHFTEPPPRYTDASLIKTLEEMGIGRPSTYAPTLETLEKRAYLERQGKSLRPTQLGRDVVDYLLKAFPGVVAYEFTARMEERLDAVEEGKAQWPRVVREFYQPFLEEFARVPQKSCPRCGRPLELKVSRFGQFLGCTGYPECRYTEPLVQKREAEPLGETCPKCGKHELVRRHGRYGSFIACTGYPECDYTRDEAPSTGLECPRCRAGEVVQKISKRGKPYYRCNNGCEFLVFDPLAETLCPLCGWNELKRKRGGCANPSCERYAYPDLDKKKPARSAAKGRGRAAKAKAPAKKATSKPKGKASEKPATWADLEPFLPALSSQDAEIARHIEGQKQSVAAVARALELPEAEVQAAHKRAMFKLRMAYGRARKETVSA